MALTPDGDAVSRGDVLKVWADLHSNRFYGPLANEGCHHADKGKLPNIYSNY